jgi:hypothetical protein
MIPRAIEKSLPEQPAGIFDGSSKYFFFFRIMMYQYPIMVLVFGPTPAVEPLGRLGRIITTNH